MSTTISPQVRAIALAGILIALAIGLGLLALNHTHSGSKTVTPPAIKPLHPHARSTAPARVAHPKTPAHVRHHAVTKPAVVAHKTATAPRTALVPRAVTPVLGATPKVPVIAAANGLPLAVAAALHKHPVVVVALYQASRTATPAQRRQALLGTSAKAAVGIDQLALGEAAAGAKDAHAGFVGVDVLSEREASPLAVLLGPLTDPTLLVYARPATLTVSIAGFVDRATVAQAAADAASAQ